VFDRLLEAHYEGEYEKHDKTSNFCVFWGPGAEYENMKQY